MTHEFKVALASIYGIEEAIFIHNLHYWITENKANCRNFFDGRFWTFNSQRAYKDLFPYMSESKIKRAIANLIEKGIIMKGNHNENQYDRTNWYAFTDEGLALVQKHYMHWFKMTNGRVQNDRPIPNNKPDNNIYNISITPSGEGSDGELFADDANSTLTMLSGEEIPMPAQTAKPNAEQTAEWFEDLWLAYERKGSKAKAKKEFEKLTEDEVAMMRRHIPAYIQSRPERQYRLDFERYIKNKTFNSVVYGKSNEMLFDPERADMTPLPDFAFERTDEGVTVTINGQIYR